MTHLPFGGLALGCAAMVSIVVTHYSFATASIAHQQHLLVLLHQQSARAANHSIRRDKTTVTHHGCTRRVVISTATDAGRGLDCQLGTFLALGLGDSAGSRPSLLLLLAATEAAILIIFVGRGLFCRFRLPTGQNLVGITHSLIRGAL